MSGGGEAYEVMGVQEMVVTGQIGLGRDADDGSGGRTGGWWGRRQMGQ